LENTCLTGRTILKWILEKCNGGHELDQCGSGEGHVAGSCESGNELPGSIKCGKFLD
jgi:hypothetical protein